jgi:adenylate kinase family enzyme
MRIYLSGSHSCGKTTLARHISKTYQLPLLPEVARLILAEKELSIQSLRTSPEIVNQYQTEVMMRQLEEEKKYKSFVADRSCDALAYAAQHSSIAHILFSDPKVQTYVESLKQKDVCLFFVRPTKSTLHNDGVRESLMWEGVVAIDAMLKMIFKCLNVPYFEINNDSMQERTHLVDNILGRILPSVNVES